MAKHIEIGLRGEDIAVHYLEEHGFRILERRYRCLSTDIDVIAERIADGSIRFVEVKSRTDGGDTQDRNNRSSMVYSDFSPVVAVTGNSGKCRRMLAAAERYMQIHNHKSEMGVDLIAVLLRSDGIAADVAYYVDILR